MHIITKQLRKMRTERDLEPTHARSWLYALLNAHPPDRKGDLYEQRVEERLLGIYNKKVRLMGLSVIRKIQMKTKTE